MVRTDVALRLSAIVLGFAATVPVVAQDDGEVARKVVELFAGARAGNSGLATTAAGIVELGSIAVPALTDGLSIRSEPEIIWALRCLKNIRDGSRADDLVLLLGHELGGVRAETITTLMSLAPSTLEDRVFELAQDPELTVRRRAFDAALEVASSDPRLVELALNGLGEHDFWLLSRSLRILARLNPQIPEQMKRLRDRGIQIAPALEGPAAQMVFELLGRKLGRDALVIVERALDRGSNDARVASINCAARLQITELAPRVRKLLHNDDDATREASVAFLAAIKDVSSASDLVSMMESLPDGKLRNSVVVGLRRMSGRSYGFEPDKWRAWLATI